MEKKAVDWRGAIAKRAAIASVLVILPTLAGFLGDAWWVLDLFAHFRVQYAAAALLCLGAALLRPARITVLPAIALLVNLSCIVPVHLDGEDATAAVPPLVVTSFNVHTNNRHKPEVIAFLERSGADVIFLYEVDQAWIDAVAKLAPPYRIVASRPARDNFGIVAIARVPVSGHRILVLSSALVASIELTIPWHGGEIVLLGTHTLPPIDAAYTAARNEQLANIASWSDREKRPHAAAGDFNATPWSAPFRSMLERGRLRGATPTATWPYHIPLSFFFRIPIDHVLLGDGLHRSARTIGDNLGSDHRSVTVGLTPRY